MNLDEAISKTISAIKNNGARHYGYDVHPSSVCYHAADREASNDHNKKNRLEREWYPLFQEAAWELTKRGWLRPGVSHHGAQAVADGGYSLTSYGSEQLSSLDENEIVLLQPGSLSAALKSYNKTFGDGFYQRSQEAIKCRNAQAWFACCAMAGAAAESVLLAVAIAKTSDEEKIIKQYRGSNGRRAILNLVTGNTKQHIRKNMEAFSGIIAIWRDEAAHGLVSAISVANADEAMRSLLHMCQFVEKEWGALTSQELSN
ncbi:hypothetical protein PsW64_04801 [Pseudovibrio sp. W64]|uniref:hypothetical protein n=1 Tax=Pseudovibrio sp. W64 TaxID=1735583 RepID=UPI0007B2B908|nr:hypothetical protein [Pseudovibrio sp. W64]KZK76642.1 hypothetical protein PsW64_04801 [Pseudovibrio sp. W64]